MAVTIKKLKAEVINYLDKPALRRNDGNLKIMPNVLFILLSYICYVFKSLKTFLSIDEIVRSYRY
jgi:hypothetical protein